LSHGRGNGGEGNTCHTGRRTGQSSEMKKVGRGHIWEVYEESNRCTKGWQANARCQTGLLRVDQKKGKKGCLILTDACATHQDRSESKYEEVKKKGNKKKTNKTQDTNS